MKKVQVQFFSISLTLIFLLGVITACSEDLGKAPTLDIFTGAIQIEGYESETLIQLNSAEQKQLQIKITPNVGSEASDYTTIRFISTNEQVFTITEKGLLLGYQDGKAKLSIVAESDLEGDKIETSIEVSVSGQIRVEKINLSNELLEGVLLRKEASLDLENLIEVLPHNAINKVLDISSSDESIVRVENSILYAGNGGDAVITVKTTDGTDLEETFNVKVAAPINVWYDTERAQWEVLNSHPLSSDSGGASGKSKDLIDGNMMSFISMVKPGKDSSIGLDETLYFTIDTGEPLKVNKLEFQHRMTNTFARLRLWGFDLEVSNDGKNFVTAAEGLIIPNAAVDGLNSLKGVVFLDKSIEQRYLRIICNTYDKTNGGAIQIAELRLGYDEALDVAKR